MAIPFSGFLEDARRDGFTPVVLSSELVQLCCVPELGGRVGSLVSRRTGREWLWRRQGHPVLFRPADRLDFGSGTFAGLDECFPTVGTSVWVDGRTLPDHGDMWAREWKIIEQGPNTLEFAVESPEWGIRLTRRISLQGGTVRFHYELLNTSDKESPALWSMHPLFAIKDGDRLELPQSVRFLKIEASDPSLRDEDAPGGRVAYPLIRPDVRLDELALPDPRQGYLKCFAGPLAAVDCSAILYNSRDGDRLEVRWDANAAPYLGLWLTRGGYRGWHHLAIEPTNAPYDRVDVAARDSGCASAVVLSPKSRRSWWVEWRLS